MTSQIISTDKLTVKQRQAVELLSIGKSISETSCTLDVSRGTLYSWLEDSEFKLALNKIIDKKLTWLTFQGIGEIEDILLHSLNPNHKLKAFEIITKMSEHYSLTDTQISKPKLDRDVLLENLLKEMNNF